MTEQSTLPVKGSDAATNAKWRPELVVFGIFVLIVVLALIFRPQFGDARKARARNECINNLKRIASALHAYHDKNGSFPPAYVVDANGKPLYSWRVLILPYLGRNDIYDSLHLDEPWDSPHNLRLADQELDVFRCPSDKQSRAPGLTNYVAVVGAETAWHETGTVHPADIKDGASQTILVVEVDDPTIHWMEPRDLEFSRLNMEINVNKGTGISSEHSGGIACVAYADGHVQALFDRISPQTLRALLTTDGGETIDLSEL